jgi:8-oxo-dGTP diphosphatase
LVFGNLMMTGNLQFMMPTPKKKMGPKVGVAGILCDRQGRVLLGRRGKDPGRGLWAFPGGAVEHGESLRQALIREFAEETGLLVHPGMLAHVAEVMAEEAHYVILDFLVTEPIGLAQAGSDVEALLWTGPDEWADLPLADGMRACLSDPALAASLGWQRA